MVSGFCLTALHKTVVVIIITLSASLETDYGSTKSQPEQTCPYTAAKIAYIQSSMQRNGQMIVETKTDAC